MSTPAKPIARQPGASNPNNPFFQEGSEWAHGLCDCFSDMKECACAYFLPCCFMMELSKAINEKAACGCFIQNRLGVYRMKVRSLLKIKGSAANDCCVVTFCGFCASIQMKLELKERGLI